MNILSSVDDVDLRQVDKERRAFEEWAPPTTMATRSHGNGHLIATSEREIEAPVPLAQPPPTEVLVTTTESVDEDNGGKQMPKTFWPQGPPAFSVPTAVPLPVAFTDPTNKVTNPPAARGAPLRRFVSLLILRNLFSQSDLKKLFSIKFIIRYILRY